jgi:hypothetical protein
MKTLLLTLITLFSLNGFAQDRGLDDIFNNDIKDGSEIQQFHKILGSAEVMIGSGAGMYNLVDVVLGKKTAGLTKKGYRSKVLKTLGFALMIVDGALRVAVAVDHSKNPGIAPVLTFSGVLAVDTYKDLISASKDKGKKLSASEIENVLLENGISIEEARAAINDEEIIGKDDILIQLDKNQVQIQQE